MGQEAVVRWIEAARHALPTALVVDVPLCRAQPDAAALQELSAVATHTVDVAAYLGADHAKWREWELFAVRIDAPHPGHPTRVVLEVHLAHQVVARSILNSTAQSSN